ncbi:SUMF1/EgtB/PvdO family nonheme iron enzyme [Neolewinella sp.]|uniref:SUMF1/EgtB/PvdO family nonheme iron enzyme n=1 Tax=Neolewinella sp. TaxID=2993543 RepID=UPI003B51BEBB
MKHLIVECILLLLLPLPLLSNNIQVTGTQVKNFDPSSNTTTIIVDLKWENAWRTDIGPANWDAAWVFIKFRRPGGSWQHATLISSENHDDAHIEILENAGAMVHHKAAFSGTAEFRGIHLIWDFVEDAVPIDEQVELSVFAIEMVYVPNNAFYVGHYRSGTGAFYANGTANNPQPYQITSEDVLAINNGPGLDYTDGSGDKQGPLPADFPKGFAAFYCMKYEVSQEQWIEFFNTLTPTQRAARDITGPGGKNDDGVVHRNGISYTGGSQPATTTLPNVPAAYISIQDGLAYLDWAGLRPMTELEYEKACRGPVLPVAEEFAWGTTEYFTTPYTLSDAGTADEQTTNASELLGNLSFNATDGNLDGPLRSGIFAASVNDKTREQTGGSYYGIMELSGNLWERVVNVSTPEGRAFTGQHGDGALATNGEANTLGWSVGNASAYGIRGGGWSTFFHNECQTSDRVHIGQSFGRSTDIGVPRGVRSL